MLTISGLENGKRLSPKIKILWYAELLLIILIVLSAIFALFYWVMPVLTGPHQDLHYDIAMVFISIIVFTAAYVFVELRYHNFVYTSGDRELIIKKGIIEKIRYIIPYEKIQDVTVSRSMPELVLGLGTLHIETAAHKVLEGEILLPGIEKYYELINELIAISKKTKEEDTRHIESHDAHIAMVRLLESINERLVNFEKTMETKITKKKGKKSKKGEIKDEPLLGR